MRGLQRASMSVTHALQSGYLRNYLLITIIATTALVGGTLVSRAAVPTVTLPSGLRVYEIGIAVIILLGAVATIFGWSRLSAVATLGIVGSGIGVFYVLYSAPDLAMTQVLVETLSVLLFVFVFFHLPAFRIRSTRGDRLRDAAISIAFGGLMTALVLAATSTPLDSPLATYYGEFSKTIAHGSNIVNVILVDFRGLDTLGEITVLSVAAIGVFALLKLRPRQGDEP
jgi:multicomponent Na+:H+ antiporter subunit A